MLHFLKISAFYQYKVELSAATRPLLVLNDKSEQQLVAVANAAASQSKLENPYQ